MRPAQRVDAIYDWELDGIKRAIGLYGHDAQNLQVGTDHQEIISSLEKGREKATEYWEKHGSGERRRVFDPKAKDVLQSKAKELGEHKALWMYLAANSGVHGNLDSRLRMRSVVDEQTVGVHVGRFATGSLVDVLVFASRAAVIAHEAAFDAFGIESDSSHLRDAVEELTDLASDF